MDYTRVISQYLSVGQRPDLNFNNSTYVTFDQYVDEQINNGNIVKHDTFSFTGEGWAKLVNNELINSPYKLVAVNGSDPRLYTRVKGQGVYFIVTNNGKDESQLIFTWSYNPFYMERLK